MFAVKPFSLLVLLLWNDPNWGDLRFTLRSALTLLTCTNFMSSLTASINLLTDLPIDLLSASYNLSIFPLTKSMSLLWTCLNHLCLTSMVLPPKHLTSSVHLSFSFLVQSSLESLLPLVSPIQNSRCQPYNAIELLSRHLCGKSLLLTD